MKRSVVYCTILWQQQHIVSSLQTAESFSNRFNWVNLFIRDLVNVEDLNSFCTNELVNCEFGILVEHDDAILEQPLMSIRLKLNGHLCKKAL